MLYLINQTVTYILTDNLHLMALEKHVICPIMHQHSYLKRFNMRWVEKKSLQFENQEQFQQMKAWYPQNHQMLMCSLNGVAHNRNNSISMEWLNFSNEFCYNKIEWKIRHILPDDRLKQKIPNWINEVGSYAKAKMVYYL